mmetsp:Transcript_17458/g.17216  ORF Transcript_17458/g.17216 Transcript_17458/m.17216 type:complete len:364 (-) Transcript_17458:196-1287(-)|eukprot:CAMPEP_0197005702 /NCGR_PEP_ID=MMETSP1380-20130617/30874_1 /TAXON_ID=5936 /ORGANISM="Euplotes crassus, Strain CT5" /LENGTH=363 /DNA_ID=CAMNT_0042424947 /DNA_START=619 /DNA_END=1710 /DNA_ORIENTATION=+
MVKLRKFRGYLAQKENIEKIISPPYDVCSIKEAREETGDNDMYYYHVNKPAIDLPDDCTMEDVANKGRENLEAFIEKGYLVRDDEERIYIYSQQLGDHLQFGVMALASIDDYDTGKIKKHEHTLPEVELERTNLCDTQCANAGPVFYSFREQEEIVQKISNISQQDHYAQVTTKDGVIHTLWKCSQEDSDWIVESFKDVDSLYIADGHHRSAAAYNVGKRRRERELAAGHEVTGEESFNFFMTVILPANQTKILPYNRLLNTLNDMTEEEFLEKIKKNFDVEEMKGDDHSAKEAGHISMYLGETWYDMQLKPELFRDEVSLNLDYTVLTDFLFKEIMGIENIKKDGRVEFVGGGRGIEYLVKR